MDLPSGVARCRRGEPLCYRLCGDNLRPVL